MFHVSFPKKVFLFSHIFLPYQINLHYQLPDVPSSPDISKVKKILIKFYHYLLDVFNFDSVYVEVGVISVLLFRCGDSYLLYNFCPNVDWFPNGLILQWLFISLMNNKYKI